MAADTTNDYFADIIRGLGMPVLVLAMLAMMLVPLPPLALDILFTFNIALSVTILLTTVYVGRPLDFAVFPTILLAVTLLRLALNIASTRVVLLNGHTGTSAAGRVMIIQLGGSTLLVVIAAVLRLSVRDAPSIDVPDAEMVSPKPPAKPDIPYASPDV